VLRALLVNRCKPTPTWGDASAVPFRPRSGLRPRPPQPKDVSVDVCFLLDCTGSMGSWMAAAKDHLAGIMQGLRTETGVGAIRVAFVGYRDYRDPDRVAVTDFEPLKNCASVAAAIAREQASGGADEPEDVACGLRACCGLAWQSHVRLVVHVADATGHGLTASLSYVTDDYPEGTPDQTETTAETVARLCDATPGAGNPGADLLFCKLNDRAADLEALYAQVYGGGGGTGTLSLLEGAHAFKDAVLGCLAESLLGLMVAPDTTAVQTFDGCSLSATLNCCNAAFKESLHAAGNALLDAQPPKAAATGAAPAEEAVAAAATPKGGAASAPMAEEESAAAAAAVAGPAARGDAARLLADLESEDLVPVRIALGLPATAGAFTSGLAESAAVALLSAGVTAADLERLGYPQPIVDVFRAAGAERLKRIA
jgi:hypothetical protein